jgi:hypothetical protein
MAPFTPGDRPAIRHLDRISARAHRVSPASGVKTAALRVSARAGILITGTEVLSGSIADRNTPGCQSG